MPAGLLMLFQLYSSAIKLVTNYISACIYNIRYKEIVCRMKKREYNYDFLRSLSMIAVIVIHVSAAWINLYKGPIDYKNINSSLTLFTALQFDAISRFAVPCFVMLSGAFILGNNKTLNYREFYHTRILKIGFPFVVFSFLYVFLRLLILVVKHECSLSKIIFLGLDIIKGNPSYHIWFLFMLCGLYLMAPVAMLFKKGVPYKFFEKTVFCFLILACFSSWTTPDVVLGWDLGRIFEYLGYFMVGYVIRIRFYGKKNNLKGYFFIVAGLIVESFCGFLKYEFNFKNILSTGLKFDMVSPYSPGIVVASLLIFCGFSRLSLKRNLLIDQISKHSFIIYLFHAGVWECLKMIIDNFCEISQLNCCFYIPLLSLICLIISYILSILYDRISLIILSKKKVFFKMRVL